MTTGESDRGWTCNAEMAAALEAYESAEPPALPEWLSTLLASGLVEDADCLLLTGHAATNHPGRAAFPDATGYEASVNHFHVDPVDDALGDLFVALAAANALAAEIARQAEPAAVRIIVSRDLAGENPCSTGRFRRLRDGERWLSGDLSGYQTEAVGFRDVV